MTIRRALLPTALVLLAGVTALGQTTTATLSGEVQDAAGAILSGVRITAKNTQTGATRETATLSDGRYSLTSLEPGQYEIRAERGGFKVAFQTGVVLTVGGATVVDLIMQVGDVSETVEVKPETTVVETTKVDLSRVIDSREIESLPNIGRNFVDFVKL